VTWLNARRILTTVAALRRHTKRSLRSTDVAFLNAAATVPGSFRPVRSADLITSWRPPDGWEKFFCRECGSHLYTTDPEQPERLSLRMGALESEPGIRPSAAPRPDCEWLSLRVRDQERGDVVSALLHLVRSGVSGRPAETLLAQSNSDALERGIVALRGKQQSMLSRPGRGPHPARTLPPCFQTLRRRSLFQRLTNRDWRQVARAARVRSDRSRDGKLRFGTVNGAVLQILHRSQGPMRFVDIHQEVEHLLVFPVHRGSVKQFLCAESTHRRPRFERVARGLYRSSDRGQLVESSSGM
jgi:hypothetical protein